MGLVQVSCKDDVDEEAEGDSNPIFGFMFGNVDTAGDLDIDYLDDEAKEHLGALAHKLPSFTDIYLSVQKSGDATQQDFDGKADNAVDYQDIEEKYEGPEVQEDCLLHYVSSVFDDENYDEADENNALVQSTTTLSEDDIPGELVDDQEMTLLPVLYREDGAVILRFSEIFGVYKSVKRSGKRGRGCCVDKDKYASMSDADVVEDDDEEFLRGLCRGFNWKCRTSVDESDLETSVAFVVDEDRRDTCLGDEPMKEDIAFDPFLEKIIAPLSPEFYLVEQQDWEDGIIWDNSPELSDRSAEILQTSGALVVEKLELQMGTEETTDDVTSQRSYPVSLEPFGPRKHSGLISSESEFHHPQLLRLESRLKSDNRKDSSITEDVGQHDAIRSYNKVFLLNKDLLDGSWLDNVIWEPHQLMTKAKLILDLQDERMLFETLNDKDNKHLKRHAGSMIISRSEEFTSDLVEMNGERALLGELYNIANDRFYSNRKSSQQLNSQSKKRTTHAVKVLHSKPGLKLKTMNAKLSNRDIANFHRPKALWYPRDNEMVLKEQGKLRMQGSMQIVLKILGGKGIKLQVNAEETISSVKAKASKRLDFKPSEAVKIYYRGVELDDHKSLALQNVTPNSLLHLVRTKIHILPRAQKVPGEKKSLRPPGAFKRKADLSVKDGHVFLMEYCEERPILLGNVGMGARLCTYYKKSSTCDQTGSSGLGNLLTLDPSDKSPFLGDIRASCSQSCIETNMYRAPIFPHKVPSTDFLLVRSPKGKLSIRRIDRIDVVGQQEPHIQVMSPSSKDVQTYGMNRLLVYLYREFRAAEKSGLHPSIQVDELSAQFPDMNEASLRKRLKHCANFQKQSNGLFCVMRSNFCIPLEEQLRRMVTPEDVCSYESMQAGLYRLRRLGITQLTSLTGLSSAMNQLPDEAIALAAASHIERELQITPWNLSSNFVACTNQNRENIERLEITGVSDPSGRGLGFSYVRAAPKGRWQRVSFLQQQTRKKCQEIWDRQVKSLSAVDDEEKESEAEANSDLDSFAGDLENLLDAEGFKDGEGRNYKSKNDNIDDVMGLIMRRHPSEAQAKEEFEDEAAEAAELCKMLMDDDEVERKKKKKMPMVEQQLRQAQSSHSVERVKKTNAGFKPHTPAVQPRIAAKDSYNLDMKQDERFPDKKNSSKKLQAKRKNEIEHLGFQKKVKILGEGIKTLVEKKSARDSFVCGACGQLGHMRTNKNCPKYREDPETQPESRATEKASGELNSLHKTAPKNTPKQLQISDMPLTSDSDTASRPIVKVTKIVFANKTRPEDTKVEQHKPSVVIKPPVEMDREHSCKKLIIKRPREHIDSDQISQEESSDLYYREQESSVHFAEASRRRNRENNKMWEEELCYSDSPEQVAVPVSTRPDTGHDAGYGADTSTNSRTLHRKS